MKITGNINLPPNAAHPSLTQTRADGSSDDMPARPGTPQARAYAPGYVRRAGMSPGEEPRGNNALQLAFFVAAILVAIVAYIQLG